MSLLLEKSPSDLCVHGQTYKSDIAGHRIRNIMPKGLARDILELSMSCGDSSKTAKFIHASDLIKDPFKPDLKRYYQPEGSYGGLRIMLIDNQRREYEALSKDFEYMKWIAGKVENSIKHEISVAIQPVIAKIQEDKVATESTIQELRDEISLLKEVGERRAQRNTLIENTIVFIVVLFALCVRPCRGG